MIIFCTFETGGDRAIEVSPNDPLYVLLDKLNIAGEATKFVFEGVNYYIASILTFQEIGLPYDAIIVVVCQAISGEGGDE